MPPPLTIPQLCATSTVGIAACGLALGRPRELHLDTRSSTTRNSSSTSASPPSTGCRRSLRSLSTGWLTNTTTSSSPSSLSIEPLSPAASSKKAWYLRFSESLLFSSAPSSSHASSSPTSTVSASNPRQRSTPSPSPHPLSINKLVKRSQPRAASPALLQPPSPSPHQLSIASPLQQPATALARDPSPISAHPPTPHHIESECDTNFRVYDPRPVASWKGFFTAKKHSSKRASIKRIYPDCFPQPTLVLAHVISDEPSDTSSVYSGQSIYYDSHPPTSIMPQSSTLEPPPPPPVQGIKIRRSFSISNILHSPRLPSRHSRRHSSLPAHHWLPQPTPYHTPSENFPSSPLPRPCTSEFQHLPPIQSVSVLNVEIEPEPFDLPLAAAESDSSLSDSSSEPDHFEIVDNDDDKDTESENILQNDSIYRPHRLSLLTNAGSERASTLIGSDDGLDRATENVFDSVRTRVNEGVTPVRVESIFDLSSSPPDMSPPLALKKNRAVPYVDEIDNVSPTSDAFRGLTPPPVKLDNWLTTRQDESDDINWGSDWDLPKNTRTDHVAFGPGGVPMAARRSESSAVFLKNSLRHDNGSRSSFEDWTEWANDCDSSNLGSSPASTRQTAPPMWRSKTAFTKGKSTSPAAPKDTPNSQTHSHSRSQSLPVRCARHSELIPANLQTHLFPLLTNGKNSAQRKLGLRL